MFAWLSLDVSVNSVQVSPQDDGRSADIQVEDASFAKAICANINNMAVINDAWSRIAAVPVGLPIAHGSNGHLVDSKKVRCSWHRPVRTVRLEFDSETIAREVESAFHFGEFKVSGQVVKSGRFYWAPDPADLLQNEIIAFTLSSIPATVTCQDVLRDIPRHLRPCRIEMGSPSYDVDPKEANNMIRSKLMQISALEYWAPVKGLGGKRAKVTARFQNEKHARNAASQLNGTSLPFGDHGRLAVQLAHSARFKVSDPIYQAFKGKIDAMEKTWKAQHLVFTSYEPT
ncbi:hypothetical protein BDW74DRAFT_73701 [Aspergillus multicolor]|uniref:uncharacterized protein n=1 Tax=Aspergillus multicolor TaxID=41759 RepID=UPI003CCDF953